MRAAARQLTDAEFEAELIAKNAEFYDDPFGWVMWAFKWGEGELKDIVPGYPDEPDEWQAAQ